MDAAILECLVCPITRSRLRLQGEFLISEVGGLKYPITDGIPQLLPAEAILPADVETMQAFKAKYLNVNTKAT